MISQEADSVFHDAIPAEERELRSFRQSCTSGCIGHETDSLRAFRPIQRFHQRGRYVIRVRDQFTTDLWLAQRKLEQTGAPINTSMARARHAVKYVCHTAHTAIECRPRFFIPGIAMSAAHADPMSTEVFDRFECSGQFGRQRHALEYFRVFEQLPHTNR